MVFGDVNLAEDQVQGKYAGDPGAGGWPTIRAYNSDTGYEGTFAGDWKDANGLDPMGGMGLGVEQLWVARYQLGLMLQQDGVTQQAMGCFEALLGDTFDDLR